MRRLIYLLFILLVLFSASCNRRQPQDTTIRIGYTEFSFDLAVAFVLKGILDQQQNVQVEMYRVDDATMFRALSTNELDIGISSWLPHTHGDLFDTHSPAVQRHAMITDSLGLYIVVPEFAPVVSISDLRENADLFRNTILLPDGRNAIHHLSSSVLEDYGLDMFTFRDSSWDDIVSFVAESMENNTNFAFVGMRPHWIFERYDIKTLRDPQGTFGTHEQAYLLINSQFIQRMPSIANFLSRVRFELSEIEAIMEMNQALASDTYANAIRWINQNTFKVNRWLMGH